MGSKWWQDPVQIHQMVEMYETPTNAARVLGDVSERTAREAYRKLSASDASLSENTPSAPVTELLIDQTQIRWSDEDLLSFHGIDPQAHLIIARKPKRWNQAIGDGQVAEMNSLSLTVVPLVTPDMVVPARSDGWSPESVGVAPMLRGDLIFVVSDTHAPYQDKGLESCINQWLARHQPGRAYDLGDLLDIPVPSRHKSTRGFEASPQEGIDERYRLDARRIAASPGTKWKVLLGNHDIRLDTEIQTKIGAHVARLARAEGDLPVMDLGFLLRYDELGIELLRPDGDYHSLTAKILDGLNARHGTKSGPHGGAVKVMARRNASMLAGHDHKQMIQQHVSYDDEENVILTLSASIGCACSRSLAGSYTEDADIHLGFATVVDHGKAGFHVELARYDDGEKILYWRDEIYTP